MPPTPTPPTPLALTPSRGSRALWVASIGVLVVALVVLPSWGGPQGVVDGVAVLVDRLLRGVWPAALYAAACLGAGRVLARLLGIGDPALAAALGAATLLTVSHGLGCLGVLRHAPVAWGVLLASAAPGVWLGVRVLRRGVATPRADVTLVPIALALGVLLVASASAPGWLWDSEFAGYDALSYHLSQPEEWARAGVLTPAAHNVYSFLPSYMEAAYLHLASLGEGPLGMLEGDGERLLACQNLHLAFTVLAAWTCGRAAVHAGVRRGLSPEAAVRAGWLAAAVVVATPWAVVTGSLAYNDMAMVALLGGACLAALDRDLPSVRRGLLAGVLMGAACSVKPSGGVIAAPGVALALAAVTPARRWAGVAIAGALGGLVVMLPWLVRNGLACGNPVFPFLAHVFPNAAGGTGAWTPGQVARFAAGHTFDGSLGRRLSLICFPDANDPAGARHRGLLHPQWSGLWPVVIAGAVRLVTPREGDRRLGVALALGLVAGLVAWLFLTHVQSRFLLAALPLAAVIVGVGCMTPSQGWSKRVGPVMGVGLAFLLAGHALVLFTQQAGGRPALMVMAGAGARTGVGLEGPARARAIAEGGPELFVNLALPPTARVYLLGDATPLYYTRPVVWNTTWDAWSIAAAMREHPDNAEAWTTALAAQGVTHVLVNMGEIARLRKSGWSDPDVEPAAVERWMRNCTTPVRVWPEVGVALVELKPPKRPTNGGSP